MKHKILFDYCDRNGAKRYIDPRSILDALDDATFELNFSNYHGNQFCRAQKIIRDWCRANGIEIGPTKETVARKKLERDQKNHADLASGDPLRTFAALHRMGKR